MLHFGAQYLESVARRVPTTMFRTAVFFAMFILLEAGDGEYSSMNPLDKLSQVFSFVHLFRLLGNDEHL